MEAYVFIKDQASHVTINVCSTNGTIIYENVYVPSNTNFILPSFEAGMYYVKVTGTNGTVIKKLIKY